MTKVLRSEETLKMVQLIYELTKSEIRSINYNTLQPTIYYFLLQLKTILLKPNFKELGKTLHQTQKIIEKSMWKFQTGRWPGMEKFMDNFLYSTVGSNASFYYRFSEEFIPEMKEMLDLDRKVENILQLILDKIASFTDRIAMGDEVWMRQFFRDIRGSKWDEIVTFYIETMALKLSRF